MKFGRERTAVEREGWESTYSCQSEEWERTDCCGERRLGENIMVWRVKVGRERTAVESEGWERTDCCGGCRL